MFEVCRTPPLLAQHETAIVDSSCTGHFLLVNASCLSKVKSRTPLMVRLPNGATMESSHTADLGIPELNAAASKAHVFPWIGTSLFTFSWPDVRRRLHSHFPSRHSHNLQLREFQTFEGPSRCEHPTMANKFEAN
jgi:hypothetical protein